MSDYAKSPTEFTRAALATLRRRWRDKIGEGSMTDLERARWLLPDGTDEVEVAELAGVIAAARREGAEPVWAKIAVAALRKAAKPSTSAQSIRAQLSLELERDDELPDWIWDLVDVAAQRGIERGAEEISTLRP